MTRQNRQGELEPLFERATILGSHDRRRSESQRDSPFGQAIAQRTDARQRRRRMTKEWVEANLGRAGIRRGVSVFQSIDLRGQPEFTFTDPVRARLTRVEGSHQLPNTGLPLGEGGVPGPVAFRHQLLDGLLAQMILFAHWKKEPRGQPPDVEGAEHKRRFAKTRELLAQRGYIERAFRRRRK